jgi:hypothetical protein
MFLNLFVAGLRLILGMPPLVGFGIAVSAMLVIWTASKFQKVLQIGLAGVAILCMVRYSMGGAIGLPADGATPAPALGATSVSASTDGVEAPVNLQLSSPQGIEALLHGNAVQLQAALAPAGSTPAAVMTADQK